jgi:hypothetical protein
MNGRFARPGNAEMRTTGADGRFSIPTRNDPYVVVVTSDDGYAFVDDRQFVRPVSVTLTPWGKVEGTLSVRGKPASGEIVDYFPGWLREGVTTDSGHARRRVSAQYQTKTDSAGRFSFDRVIPGSGTVAREVRNKVLGRSDTAWTHKTRIAVVAGRTTQVDLRGIGRPVVGRIELPPAFAKTFDWKHSLPIEVAQVLAASDENWRPSYLVPVKADGTFRIDDVLPGHYRLHLDLRQLGPNGEWVGWTMLGEANLDFEATEQSAQHASKPLDLGTIHGRRFPSVGDMAPDFSADLVDGAKPIRLSDLRGKVVLIGFWGPGRDFKNYERSLRSWKAIVEKHAHEKGLMLLTIAPSADGARVKEVLKAAVIQGVHATVEHQLESIGPPYLVGYLPYTVIVGPDGRIAAQALGGEDLERAIDRALEEDHSLPKAKR